MSLTGAALFAVQSDRNTARVDSDAVVDYKTCQALLKRRWP